MSALLVVQWIVRILLILLAVVLMLLLLVLFVPIRYAGQIAVTDPEPHEAAEWDRVLHSAAGSLRASWMGPLLRLTIDWQDELQMDLQILFTHRDPRSLLPHKEQEPAEEEASQDDPKPSWGDRLRKAWRRLDYYKRVLQKEETGYSMDKGKRILFCTLHRILPRRWQLEGDIGLGDPAATAKVLEIQGMLIPLTVGHVVIRPQFLQYQLHGNGYCKGCIRLIHLVIPILQIVTDRRMMQTLRRVRNADRNIEQHYRQSAVNGG